jgi:hypothetical protein
MEHSSNTDMENIFQSLEKIKTVAPVKDLYKGVLQKDFAKKNIPTNYSIFAILFLCSFISIELFIAQKQKTKFIKNNMAELMPINNNNLYNE